MSFRGDTIQPITLIFKIHGMAQVFFSYSSLARTGCKNLAEPLPSNLRDDIPGSKPRIVPSCHLSEGSWSPDYIWSCEAYHHNTAVFSQDESLVQDFSDHQEERGGTSRLT